LGQAVENPDRAAFEESLLQVVDHAEEGQNLVVACEAALALVRLVALA
jgi:hypothetical protein